MYAGTADMVRIESDERGFELHIATDEGYFSFNVQGVAVELLEEVRRTIGEWLAEGQEARVVSLEEMREWPAYELSDPKHPTYHERMSAIYDDREKV